ncbi:MAG: glycosyltransferase [Hyphomonadaceae bacterium]|nr:glycosyltransferase [Clostridia bacterium]
MPLISIIVAVYNVEKYIDKCLESILAQTFADFELILVDDGSTDRSGNICDSFALEDGRINVIHKENGGLSAARNAGLDIAKGDFIGFIDGDDYIHSEMYRLLYNEITTRNGSIALCEVIRVDNSECDIFSVIDNQQYHVEELSNMDVLERMHDIRGWLYVVACNKLYRKNIFDNLRYPLNRLHEDEFLAHRILFNTSKVVSINVPMYFYLQRDGSIMNVFSIKRLDALHAYSERITFFEEQGLFDLREKVILMMMLEFIHLYFSVAESEPNHKKSLKQYWHMYNKFLVYLLCRNSISVKQKLMFLLFFASPKAYKMVFNYRAKIRGTNFE